MSMPSFPLPSPPPPQKSCQKIKTNLLLCKLLLPYYRVHDRLDWSLVLFVMLGVLCRICIPVSSERKLLLKLIFFRLSLCLWHEFVAAWGWFRDHWQWLLLCNILLFQLPDGSSSSEASSTVTNTADVPAVSFWRAVLIPVSDRIC